jgi:hypothetical protein
MNREKVNPSKNLEKTSEKGGGSTFESSKENVGSKEISFEQLKSVEEIFKTNPELEKAAKEAFDRASEKHLDLNHFYLKYIESVFPDSQLKNIVWHGGEKDKRESGFEKNANENDWSFRGGSFYGFYFGDRYSHYGWGEGKMMHHPAVVNVKEFKIVMPGDAYPSLSSIDMNRSIKEQYDINDEDGILQIGTSYANEHAPYEEYLLYEKQIEEKAKRYFANRSPERITPKEIMEYLEENGLDSAGIHELVVFEPEQVHILGSKSDIENFKTWAEKNSEA